MLESFNTMYLALGGRFLSVFGTVHGNGPFALSLHTDNMLLHVSPKEAA